MRHETGQITTSDGLSLYAETWRPDTAPKAMLAFVHGLGEHIGRYQHFAKMLTNAGYGLHMADLRGHGHSPGQRGHVNSFGDYNIDAHAMMDYTRQIESNAKHFFGGHSMGGLIALSVAEENPPGYQGVLIGAPALRGKFEVPGWKITLGKVFSQVMPSMSMTTGLPVEGISRDEQIVAAYQADPLVHGVVSARHGIELIGAGPHVLSNAHLVKLPLLIWHGSEDQLADPAASEEFYQKAGSTDKTRLVYEGYYHEVHNEPEKEQAITDMIQWMDAHL